MNETKENLLEGLGYVQGMLQSMQSVLTEYINLERAFRSKQASIGTSSTEDRKKLALITIGLAMVLNYFVCMVVVLIVSGGLRDNVGVLILFAFMAVLMAACVRVVIKGKKKSIVRRLAVVYLFLIGVSMVIELASNPIALLPLVPVIAAEYFFITRKNRTIAAQNQEVEAYNADIRARREALYSRYTDLQKELSGSAPAWFPPDYYNMEAVSFFISAVRNNRAESVKEMVNLFEATAQHQEMVSYQRQQTQQLNQLVNGQQAIQNSLRFANMMSVASFIQTAAIGRDVSRAASSVSQMASDVRGIRNRLG